MSETKTIDMSACIGSHTLCESHTEIDDSLWKLTENDIGYEMNARVAQDIWQSTQNIIEIPHGLICDVQYIDHGGAWI